MGFSYILTSTDCLARIMLQQHRLCIYKGKINVKLPNAFKCLLCNVLYICSVHFLLNLGADAKNYLFHRHMTESSQSEILNNSMLKIQYKHESLIFFFARRKTRPYRFLKYNAMLLNWMLVYLKYFLNNSPFLICRVYICAIFPNSEGSSPIPKTRLWNASVRSRLFCALCWKYCWKKKKKKKKNSWWYEKWSLWL